MTTATRSAASPTRRSSSMTRGHAASCAAPPATPRAPARRAGSAAKPASPPSSTRRASGRGRRWRRFCPRRPELSHRRRLPLPPPRAARRRPPLLQRPRLARPRRLKRQRRRLPVRARGHGELRRLCHRRLARPLRRGLRLLDLLGLSRRQRLLPRRLPGRPRRLLLHPRGALGQRRRPGHRRL